MGKDKDIVEKKIDYIFEPNKSSILTYLIPYYVENQIQFDPHLDYNFKMILLDAQTSGGLLMSVSKEKADALLSELKNEGYPFSSIVGSASDYQNGPYISVV